MSVLCAALCLALGSAQSEGVMRVDWSSAMGADSEVAAARRDFVAAVNAGDPAAESFYAPDAVAMTLDRAHRTFTLVPRRFDVGKDIGSETGTYVETRSEGAEHTTVEGLYVTIYTRGRDDRWRVAMEVWTTGLLRRQ
jgi:ketosteroid isomerase-like protein